LRWQFPPRTAAELEAFLAEIRAAPDVQEASAAFVAASERDSLAAFRSADGSWDPERAREHERIVADLLRRGAPAPPGAKPIAVLVIGLPGCGKSSFLVPAAKSRFNVAFTEVNPDLVKEHLPGYEGWNADYFHRESSFVAKRLLFPLALDARHNLLFDEVGGDAEVLGRRVDLLLDEGYEVHVVCGRIPASVSVWRAVKRFREKGRWVPPEVILDGMEQAVLRTYETLREKTAIRSLVTFDMDVLEGETPSRIDEVQR
jgi:hypothetical protein